MTAITERLRFCWESAKVAGLLVSGCVAWAMGAVISDICPYLLPVLSTLPLFDAWMHISGVRWLTKDWEDLHACTSIIILELKLGPFCLTTGEMQSYLQIGRKTISWYFPISFFFWLCLFGGWFGFCCRIYLTLFCASFHDISVHKCETTDELHIFLSHIQYVMLCTWLALVCCVGCYSN